MIMFRQMKALALGAALCLLTGCGSEERAQIGAAFLPQARASVPPDVPTDARHKRRGGPVQTAAASSAASAAASAP